MELPQHVQDALGVTSPITEDDLAAHDGTEKFAQASFGLSGAELASAAAVATSGNLRFTVTPTRRAPLSWNYMEISIDGVVEGVSVCTPESVGDFAPTAASSRLVGAWLSDQTLIDSDNVVSRHKIVQGVRAGVDQSAFQIRLLKTWAEVCSMLDGCPVPPIWISNNQMRFAAGSRVQGKQAQNNRYQDLFIEVVSEVKTKWRYLSLYRIFEHGYLSEVFDVLAASFFVSPKDSLDDATKALESELNQFLALVHNAALENYFESLHDAFVKSKAAGNRFALALDHSFQKTGQPKAVGTIAEKGVFICYKIRCAIVHAGVASPIFDAYGDGPACLEELLPACESAVLQFLGISIL